MFELKRLKPTNRHLLIVPHEKNKKEELPFGIVLPETNEEQSRYIEATVVDVAPDCASQFKKLKYENRDNPCIIVDRTMIEKVEVGDVVHHLILENYVMGLYGRPDAL